VAASTAPARRPARKTSTGRKTAAKPRARKVNSAEAG